MTFHPNPKQSGFIQSRSEADFFSSRMGEGKSAALTWAAFYHTRHNPGAIWVMIRDTWENMRATTLKEFVKWFPPGVAGQWVAGEKKFIWSGGLASGEVHFLGLDDPDDASKLQSRELAGVGMDEVTPAGGAGGGIDELVFDVALGRLRQPGMNWYAAKLAANNPDETHWLYRRFVDPGFEGDPALSLLPLQVPGFRLWHPLDPENVRNLPTGYYERLRKLWGHRTDLTARFVEGKFGFQQVGTAVTPEWIDAMHLALGLGPVRGYPLYLLWDFGHNPTCIVTQVTPLGHWLVLDAMVGEGIGVEELIENEVKPLLATRYQGYVWKHIGDPAGRTGEQTSVSRSAVSAILRILGGPWRDGPIKPWERIEPLRAVLSRNINGTGVVQVDREHARVVWQALRGGWHFHVPRSGVKKDEPLKDFMSHPGDAMGYGAAILFPMRRMQRPGDTMGLGLKKPQTATYFEHAKQKVLLGPDGKPARRGPITRGPAKAASATTGRPVAWPPIVSRE